MEESTAASHALAQETEQLASLIGTFHIGQKVAAASPRRPAHKPPSPAPQARTVARPVAALKTVGRSSPARKPDAANQAWQEF